MGFCGLVKGDLGRFVYADLDFPRPSWLPIALWNRGFHLTFSIRLSRQVLRIPLLGKPMAKTINYAASLLSGCEISLYAKLGTCLYLPHAVGIVIGEGVTIGNNVTILQNVTLGRRHRNSGGGVNIQDGAFIGCGACILGDIQIGRNAVIGANAVVLNDVPEGARAVGVPARVL